MCTAKSAKMTLGLWGALRNENSPDRAVSFVWIKRVGSALDLGKGNS